MVFAKNISVTFPATRGRNAYRIRRVVSFSAEKAWEQLTDRAEVVISKYIKGVGIEEVRSLFKVGDPIQIQAGYDGILVDEFTGYISEVNDELHLTFKCQDEMYMLKKGSVNFNKKNCKLNDLLKVVASGYEVDAIDAELGSVRIKSVTPAQVLLELKDKYGIYSYFEGKKLVSGRVYSGNNVRKILNFDNQRNIKSHSLTYQNADDRKVKIRVTSVKSDGTKLEVVVGDQDGQESSISLYGITSKSDLKKKADEKLKLMKVDGYTGDIVLFAIPYVKFGDEVELQSAKHPDRNGVYYVDATHYKYGPGAGIERVIKIGRKVA